jgi:cytochrome c biogenesis protein CcmG, thiol:disulfide interchange protein DsbE
VTVGPEVDGPTESPTSPPSPAPGRHTARWVAVFVLIVSAGLVAVLATRPSAQTVEARNPLVDTHAVAPPIAGATVDGTSYRLPRVPGRYVVLNFFASWCVPCQEEGPELVAFQFQHHLHGDASVLSVVFEDTIGDARAYQQKLGVTWPTMTDNDGALALAYGVRSDPTSFLIAPDGRVVASVTGGATAEGLNRLLARAEASGYGT